MQSDLQLLHLCRRKHSKAQTALRVLLPILGIDEEGNRPESQISVPNIGGWHILEDGTPVDAHYAQLEKHGDLALEIAQTSYLQVESDPMPDVLAALQIALGNGRWDEAEIEAHTLYSHLSDLPKDAFYSWRNIERIFEDIEDAISFLRASDFEMLWGVGAEDSSEDSAFEGVDRKIMEGFLNKPETLYSADPRFFEELVATIFSSRGYDVRLTKRTSDGGRDIIAIGSPDQVHVKYLIECKRYKKERKINVAQVRQLFGVQQSERATKAILATTSGFTKPERKFASQHLWQLQLIDYTELLRFMRKSLKST
jgi:hypothetical protein